MQVEPCEIPFAGVPEILVGNGFKPFPTMYAATSLPRALTRARMRVPLRRIRSNSWHAREMVNGPEYTADGRFSTACKTITFFPTDREEVLFPFSQILDAMPQLKRVIFLK